MDAGSNRVGAKGQGKGESSLFCHGLSNEGGSWVYRGSSYSSSESATAGSCTTSLHIKSANIEGNYFITVSKKLFFFNTEDIFRKKFLENTMIFNEINKYWKRWLQEEACSFLKIFRLDLKGQRKLWLELVNHHRMCGQFWSNSLKKNNSYKNFIQIFPQCGLESFHKGLEFEWAQHNNSTMWKGVAISWIYAKSAHYFELDASHIFQSTVQTQIEPIEKNVHKAVSNIFWGFLYNFGVLLDSTARSLR